MHIVINPKYESLREKIEKIPLLFESKGEVVYEGRNVLKRAYINDIDVVVKSFKRPHIINRIVYSYFRKSKAERSFVYSNAIIQHGFRSPEPIAMIEQYKFGLLTNSYYICRYEQGDTVRALMDGVVEGNEDKLISFAQYTADLHLAGILHLDFSPGNILIHPTTDGYSFSLIDMNRMKIVDSVDCNTAAENLRRLCNSREVLDFIAAQYASFRGWNAQEMQKLVTCYSDKFFVDFIYRRSIKKLHKRNMPLIILSFKLSRKLRKHMSQSSFIGRKLYNREKKLYEKYFSQYDYRHVFTSEYLG